MAGRTAPEPIRPFDLDFTPMRKLRKFREVSAPQIARATGLHWTTVYRIENNRGTNTSAKALFAFSRAYGVPIQDLVLLVEPRAKRP
jgi:transcriptional regulator with XRE-family HTH domain